ncbi:hypothetical protein TNCV_1808341 [Trichonephila clavipes]|nr:hypothetical protein TNCV_1808341 [Trichonephila clavipes]
MLKHLCSSDKLSQTQAFEWHRRFRKGRESFEEVERSGRPQTPHTVENLKRFLRWCGSRYQSADEIISASGELRDMAKNGFEKCSGGRNKRWNVLLL